MIMARVVVVGPLGKLGRAAQELEHGGKGEVDIRTTDEVGQLAFAFRQMAGAIRVREERIGARNRDMRLVLDNVGQGFVTLDVTGAMSQERSRVIDEWFGAVDRGTKLWDYLARVDVSVAQWFQVGLGRHRRGRPAAVAVPRSAPQAGEEGWAVRTSWPIARSSRTTVSPSSSSSSRTSRHASSASARSRRSGR